MVWNSRIDPCHAKVMFDQQKLSSINYVLMSILL